MKFKFENLIVWQKAMGLAEYINKMSYKFPKEEVYNLSSQIRRAADSIALHISEGSIGQTTRNLKDLSVMQFAHWPKWLLACTKQRGVNIYQSKSLVSIMNMPLT